MRYKCSEGECSEIVDQHTPIYGNVDFLAKFCMLNGECDSFQYDKKSRNGYLCKRNTKRNESLYELRHCTLQKGIPHFYRY